MTMELDETLIKFWLLNVAAEFPRDLGLLFPAIECEALNVREIPGCQSHDYETCLVNLFETGLIALESDFPEDDVSSRSGVLKAIERFRQLSKTETQVRYVRSGVSNAGVRSSQLRIRFLLTASGGHEWEKYAEPDWNRYVAQFSNNGDGEIISQNLDLLIAVLGWFRETSQGQVLLGSIRLQEAKDYPILYWKTLPKAYKTTFQFEHAEPRWNGNGPAWLNAPIWFREWWNSVASGWYRKPWEHPAWPQN